MSFEVEITKQNLEKVSSKREIWTIEECASYVENNRKKGTTKRSLPLHELLQGCNLVIKENEYKPPEGYKKRIEALKLRQAQRDYQALTKEFNKAPTSLNMATEIKNPVESSKDALSVLIGALTVGFFVFTLFKSSLGEKIALSIAVVCGALMLILETVLLLARSYLSENPDPATKIQKQD